MRMYLLAAPLLLAAAWPRRAESQGASSYVSLDHPLLPLFEHLVARGDLEDPSPMVRPFRRGEALRVLGRTDTANTPRLAAQVRRLLVAFDTLPPNAGWALSPRVGFQAYTSARRDPDRPAGPRGIRPYVELGAEARFGAVVAVTRPAIEPRLTRDPDWTGRRDLKITGRQVDAYLGAQFRWVRFLYGQLERNWGPVGLPGIPLSNLGYGRPEFGVELGNRTLRLTALAAGLQSVTDSAGQVYQRYLFAHRLDARLSSRVRLGLWETGLVAGVDQSFDGRYRNPVSLLLLANQYGLGDKANNVMIGLDLHWRVSRAATIQGQLAIDDLQYQNRGSATRYPDRYAFTLAAHGPLGRSLSWHGAYTKASSLAFRTFQPAQDYLDGGVGIGRTYDDYDQVVVSVGIPVGTSWLVTPGATLIRQGQGRIEDPVPSGNSVAAGATPELFIGTVERGYRLSLQGSGSAGPLALHASAGYLRRVNAGNVAGRTRGRFEGSVFVTLGFRRQGLLGSVAGTSGPPASGQE